MTTRQVATGSRTLIVAQLLLALTAFIVSALLPAPGEAALYLPLAGGAARAVAFAGREHTQVLARGPYPGSLVLRAPSRGFALAALADRALVIAVSEPACLSSPKRTADNG